MVTTGARKKTLTLPLHFLDERKAINFDVYVWAGGKPVLYCRADDLNLSERISKLKSKKNLKHFLVLKEHYSSFISYLSMGLEEAFENSSARSLKEQVDHIYYQQRGLLLVLSADPSSKENFSVLRATCGPFYNFFTNTPQALEHLYTVGLEENDFDVWLNHSIRVAALSSLLISKNGADEAGKPIFDVVMGAFVHDFSFVEEEWDQSLSQNIKDSIYKNHPAKGVALLNFDHVNPWVRSVILKHEEHADATGFPAGLREDDMDPTLLCVAVANAFDRLKTLQKKSFEDALKQILIDKMGAYPLPYLQSLQAVIKAIS